MQQRRSTNQRVPVVRVSFEASRLSSACLAEAYERLVPPRRRALRSERTGKMTVAMIETTRQRQGGATGC
jgi:hypothetical protein